MYVLYSAAEALPSAANRMQLQTADIRRSPNHPSREHSL